MIELLLLPLLMLNNLTADDFCTEANWSECPEEVGVRHYYSWHGSKDSSEQYAEIYSQKYWGLPKDTKFKSGVGPIQWFYIYSTGPVYSVYLNNQSYSNSTDIGFTYGYLPKPKKKVNGITLDEVLFSPVEYKYNNNVVTSTTTATVKWHTRTKRALSKGYNTKYYSKNKTISCEYINDTSLWPELNAYNEVIPVTVTNHSAFTTVSIDMPDDVSYYHIKAESENHTAYFIKTNYIYYPLAENCYYIEQFEIINNSGMRPYGKNRFMLPVDEYNIIVYAGTPFETVELNLNVTYTDATHEPPEPNREYLIGLLTLFTCVLVVRHYNGPY